MLHAAANSVLKRILQITAGHCLQFAGVSRGNKIRGNKTRNWQSERGALRGSLRGGVGTPLRGVFSD